MTLFKRFRFIIPLATAIAVAGCSGSAGTGGKQADKTGEKPADAGKEVVIRMWGASDFLKEDNAPGVLAINEFNEKHKGKIRVERKYMPWTEFNTAVQAAVTSNDLPDIFQTPTGMDIRSIIDKGWIQPYDGLVSENWKKQFMKGAMEEGINVINGKTYAWPLTGPQLNGMLYYNKEVLKNAGLDPNKPPKTWEELRSMAKTVSDKGKGDVFGLVLGLADTPSVLGRIGPLVQGTPELSNEGFNYKTGKYPFDSKPWADAIRFMISMKNEGSILPASYTIKSDEAAVLFGENKAAFLVDSRARMWLIKRDTPKAQFGMAMVPTQDGSKPYSAGLIARSDGFMIAKTTKHAKEVGIFIEEFASPLFYNKYIKGGVALTPIESINKDKNNYPYPEFEQFYQLHTDHWRLRPDPSIRNQETTKVISELGSMKQPKIKPSIDEVIQKLIITGNENEVEKSLKDYNAKVNKGLEDAVNKVKQAGGKVDMSDFMFSNWDPAKDYTEQDYKASK
ncbi:MAG: transporter substrate-binding protein [Paenibacillus sp.]|jgi:ABC-type glycerol-3-phosphate transport system substrate-binding protein|nr:transporter substrate-binding protein [Paenibacillus sp.]